MEGKDELKENDIKNRTYYYFNDITRDLEIDFDNILLDKKSYKSKYKNILIMTFHTKLSWLQIYCVLGSIK